ncbi:LuxR C-terminal-related transcriptional regulator [Streptomyces sp. NPDC127068]|uniref:helix-turn-helix transcriptional regulator n=1 Tax=Streptomyces sp. NPDC127068 TaxID=3347127 RepID=UPI0036605727
MSSLASFGVDSKAQAVYTTLLAHPNWALGEIAESLQISPPEVKSALHHLIKNSLLYASSEKTGRYIPLDPEVGLVPVIERIEAELDARRSQLARDRATISELRHKYTDLTTRHSSITEETFDNVEAAEAKLLALTKKARKQIDILGNFELIGEGSPQEDALISKALSSDLAVRSILLESMRNSAPQASRASWISTLGADVRTAPTLPSRMVIYDRSTVAISGAENGSGAEVAVITASAATHALQELFELVWIGSSPLESPHNESDRGALGSREMALLRMLAAGLTDDGIARQLDVSLRTVRRHTSQLFEKLTARSRFQAGAEAARRGWI